MERNKSGASDDFFLWKKDKKKFLGNLYTDVLVLQANARHVDSVEYSFSNIEALEFFKIDLMGKLKRKYFGGIVLNDMRDL